MSKKITKQCGHCGINFESYVKRDRKYCSRKCSNENYSMRLQRKVTYKCEECGGTIDGVKSVTRKFCSMKCRNLYDSKNMRGPNNPNFGKRRPGMFKHTDEAKRRIKDGVIKSWKTVERIDKHQDFLQKYKDLHGYLPMQSPDAKLKSYISFLNSLGSRRYGGWKGIKCGWYTSIKTGNEEYYASSYELLRMEELDVDDSVITWTKRHPFLVNYTLGGISKKYKPDFYVEYDTGVCVIEEIKGYVKMEEREAYCEKVKASTEYFSKMGMEYFVNFKYNLKNEVNCD